MGSYGEFGKREWENDLPLGPDEIHRQRKTVIQLAGKSDLVKELENGANPVELSILKWKTIQEYTSNDSFEIKTDYKNLVPLIGYDTCALCLYSIQKYRKEYGEMKSSSDKCLECPLAPIDQCTLENSAFRKIDAILETCADTTTENDYNELNKDLEENISAMINNLEKIT